MKLYLSLHDGMGEELSYPGYKRQHVTIPSRVTSWKNETTISFPMFKGPGTSVYEFGVSYTSRGELFPTSPLTRGLFVDEGASLTFAPGHISFDNEALTLLRKVRRWLGRGYS